LTLTDTHCHLDFNKFDPDRSAVLERAAEAGVERILIPGITLTSSRAAVELAESHPMLFAAVGIHPTETSNVERSTFEKLRNLAQNPKVRAIGEIGLDYYWDAAPHDLQQRVLQAQLDVAAELGLPVVIHLREKDDAPAGPCASDLLNMLEKWVAGLRSRGAALAERPGVLHSFSGSLETARRAIGLGFYIGVTGPVTYRRERQELIAALPLERLLIETDSPFLAPAPHRGKRNEPAFVALIADKIAMLHACRQEQAAAITTANAQRLFCWTD
jgi:TatD DNase family protein